MSTFEPSSALCWSVEPLAVRIAPLAAVALKMLSPSATRPLGAGTSTSLIWPSVLPLTTTSPLPWIVTLEGSVPGGIVIGGCTSMPWPLVSWPLALV